jgi:glycogen debranching enzyme
MVESQRFPQELERSEQERLRSEALNTLLANRKTGKREGLRFSYVCPSKEKYPNQFLWDSCFHAIALSALGEVDLAKEEIYTLLSVQREDGKVPMQICWEKSTLGDLGVLMGGMGGLPGEWKSRLTQPPVLAQAVERIWQVASDEGFLEEVLPKVKKFYLYLAQKRDPDQDGLVSVIANLETGMDASPSFDLPFGIKKRKPTAADLVPSYAFSWAKNFFLGHEERYLFSSDHFNVEDVGFNSIYAQGLESLSRLCQVTNDSQLEAFRQMAEKVKGALIDKCYDWQTGLFYSLYSKKEKKARVKTSISLMPLILDLPKNISQRLVEEHIASEEHFWRPYPVSSVSKSEPTYNPSTRLPGFPVEFLWRGSTWININWFIYHGLRRNGFSDLANDLVLKSKELVLKSGFVEHYNPETGEGLGAKNYSWLTLVLDMI